MLLDLADVDIRARISPLARNRVRLVLDYPHNPVYRDRVMAALSDLLRPITPQATAQEKEGSDHA